MKILGYLPLPYLVFAYQLTAVVNVTLQLINVTVLDNCKSADISGVNWDVCGGKSAHLFWISTLAFVGELYWQTAKLSILGVEFRFWHKAPHNCFFAQSCFRRSVNSCWKCDHAVYVNVVNWNVCGSMSVHVFLHSNLVFVSLGEGYEMWKLNFLMRYVNFHSISKYASRNHVITDATRLNKRPNSLHVSSQKSTWGALAVSLRPKVQVAALKVGCVRKPKEGEQATHAC